MTDLTDTRQLEELNLNPRFRSVFFSLALLIASSVGCRDALCAAYKTAYWRMESQIVAPNNAGTPAFVGVADSNTGPGQGIFSTGSLPAAIDDLITFNGLPGGPVSLSTNVAPASMFINGHAAGNFSYNAEAITNVDGALFFPQDQYGDEFDFIGSFSIELFFKTDGDRSNSGVMQLVSQGSDTGRIFRYGIDVNEASPGEVRFKIANSSLGQTNVVDAGGINYADGRWHYLLAVCDAAGGGNGQLRLTIVNADGNEANSTNNLPAGFFPLPTANNGNLFLGRYTYPVSQLPRTFLGFIDEVQISAGLVPDSVRLGRIPSIDTNAALSRIFNVVNYGATTNADLAIQTCMGLAAPGDTIYFPDGTYHVTNTIVPASGLTLTGESQNGVVLLSEGQGNMVDLSGQSGVVVSSLTLDANMNPAVGRGIYASQGDHFNLHNLTIRNFSQTNNYGPFGIHFNGLVTNCTVAENQISNIGTNSPWGGGIRCSWGASGNRILRNHIGQTGRGGIFADNGSTGLIIRSNNISSSGLNSTALGIELWGGCGGSVVEDNVLDHWLSVDSSSYSAIRRNIVRDLSERILAWAGLELVASTNVVFTDNLVDHGQCIGVSISNDPAKDYIYWAYNTIRFMAQWGAQMQGDANGSRYHYFYRNKFLNTVANHANAPYPGDSGHGFRFNMGDHSIVLDSNEIADNQGIGLQFSSGIDQIAVINNTITNNAGPIVTPYPAAAVDLEWSNNIIAGLNAYGVPVSRGYSDARPIANFTCLPQAFVGQSTSFTNTSTDTDGSITHVLWDFGAGIPSTVFNPTFNYSQPGDYRVSLVVWDDAGRAGRAETFVHVVAPSLVIAYTNNVVQLLWPDWASNFTLWNTTTLVQPSNWLQISNPPTMTNGSRMLQVPSVNPGQFFRLKRTDQ